MPPQHIHILLIFKVILFIFECLLENVYMLLYIICLSIVAAPLFILRLSF